MAGLPARLRTRLAILTRSGAEAVYALPLYRLSLTGRTPAQLRLGPVDPWPGRPDLGAEILAGHFRLAGWEVAAGKDVWHLAGAPGEWREELHGFAWLRHLRMLGGDEARRAARRLTAGWIAANADWSLPAWRSDVLAARLVAWLTHYDTFFASGEDAFRRAAARSMSAQLRHLGRAWRIETQGSARVLALKGLVFGALCFGGRDELVRPMGWLEEELERQVLADGGHVERSPGKLMAVLRDLLELRATLGAAQQEVPDSLQQAIDRMAPMLRYLRGGDGALARFNGAGGEDPLMLSAVLDQANSRGRPATRAPAAGFERLAAGPLTVLVDSGPPPPPPWDADAHTGTLSLEVTVGRERLFVNCGAATLGRATWRDAERATAAHSTMVVSNRNSSALGPDGHIGARSATVTVERESADGATLLSLSHDGYMRTDGVTHRRRLFLSADGEDFRGEDRLSGRDGVAFALRFHLYPSVNATLLQNGRAVLLKLPRGGGWRLRSSRPMEIADSIYFDGAAEPRRTRQIVVPGVTAEGGATVKWALRREGPRD